VSQDKGSLSSLTLRQLRQQASALGVPLYSRKSKEALIRAIDLYQEKKDQEQLLIKETSKESSLSKELSGSPEITKIVFLPRDPEWAYVFWEISEKDRNKALAQGATRLSLRLVDVTGKDIGGINKGTLREVTVDSHSTEWYLPIPLGDRDYQVELGYRYKAQWISLAFSSSARVPSQHPSEVILDQFVPFSLETSTSFSVDNLVNEESGGDSRLHHRLYQSATTTFRKTRVGSEEFQENALLSQNPQGVNDSGAGIWASGRNDSGIGFVSSENPFWLVADAELIVYGSTDPTAQLTIGSENVPLAADGTFRLQVPFRDGIQNYLINATDSEGKEQRNITMKFERNTPEDNTNPRDKESSEWF
tara:strand:+ start:1825 stop:2913 length:1089 start_codon:yes stop_codon:yes gene_type:complete